MYQCPRCNTSLQKAQRGHFCSSCGFEIPYVFRGHRLTHEQILSLLTKGTTGKSDLWQTKDGGRRLRGELKLSPDFRLVFTAERITYANCPRCKQGLYRFSHGIMCCNCDFTFFNKFGGRKLADREMMQVLVYKRSDKFDRFVSKETGKYFSARIVIDEMGDIGFDFK